MSKSVDTVWLAYAQSLRENVDDAKQEALRFVRACDAALLGLEVHPHRSKFPELAACKRASMDLTRQLAKFRKPV